MKKLVAFSLGVSLIMLNAAEEHPKPFGGDDRSTKRPRVDRSDQIIQERRNQALLQAAENGNGPLVRTLISDGADVDVVDQDGLTALMYAADNGNAEVAGELLSAGANVEKGSDGITALTIAAEKDHFNVVQQLSDKGADVNNVNSFGWSALLFAAQNENDTMVEFLLNNNALFPTPEEMNRVNLSQQARQLLQRYKHLYPQLPPRTIGIGS